MKNIFIVIMVFLATSVFAQFNYDVFLDENGEPISWVTVDDGGYRTAMFLTNTIDRTSVFTDGRVGMIFYDTDNGEIRLSISYIIRTGAIYIHTYRVEYVVDDIITTRLTVNDYTDDAFTYGESMHEGEMLAFMYVGGNLYINYMDVDRGETSEITSDVDRK
jgi:hypothetical protein